MVPETRLPELLNRMPSARLRIVRELRAREHLLQPVAVLEPGEPRVLAQAHRQGSSHHAIVQLRGSSCGQGYRIVMRVALSLPERA